MVSPGFARLCAWLAEECDGIANGIQKVFLGTFDHGGVAVRGLGLMLWAHGTEKTILHTFFSRQAKT
eukprot:4147835-Amphidinium_carterae.1